MYLLFNNLKNRKVFKKVIFSTIFQYSFQTTSSSSSKQPPYSPRSSLLSPVKFGDQLQPQLKAVQPPSGSSYTSYRLPSYSKDNLIDKLRQVKMVCIYYIQLFNYLKSNFVVLFGLIQSCAHFTLSLFLVWSHLVCF